jgi:hypothetical protein
MCAAFKLKQSQAPKNEAGDVEPVPMGPNSDKTLPLRDSLVSIGVSEEGANQFVKGTNEGEDISDYLSDEDTETIKKNIGKILTVIGDNADESE